MRKKTTTTFTVTVTHRGPYKLFENLFGKRSGTIINSSEKLITTDTESLPAIERYSKGQKLVRLFIKKAAEEAGLVYDGRFGSRRYREKTKELQKAWYFIDYGYNTFINGQTRYNVELEGVVINFFFDNGINNKGSIEIQDFTLEGPRPQYLIDDIDLTNPNTKDNLISVFKEWGFKYINKDSPSKII